MLHKSSPRFRRGTAGPYQIINHPLPAVPYPGKDTWLCGWEYRLPRTGHTYLRAHQGSSKVPLCPYQGSTRYYHVSRFGFDDSRFAPVYSPPPSPFRIIIRSSTMDNHRRRTLMSLFWITALLAACHLPVRVAVQPTETPTVSPSPIESTQTIPPTVTVQLHTATIEPSATAAITTSSTPTTRPSSTPSPIPTQESFPTETLIPLPTATWDPNALSLWLTALQNTNCRAGPGIEYEVVAYLLEGARVPAYARDRLEVYWLIQSPQSLTERCWVWIGSTKIEGNSSTLPIFEPPFVSSPTATP